MSAVKNRKEALQAALSCLDETSLLDLTRKLIAIPSHHGLENPEREMAAYLERFLVEAGLTVCRRLTAGGRFNVIATLGKNRSPEKTLMLNGHMDTVGVENMKGDPFSGEIVDGKIFGRGSVDMKAALASMIHAVLAVKEAGIPLEGQVVFAGVADEELWNAGTRDIVARGPRTKYAIVGEPTGLRIDHGHRALEWIEIVIRGRAAHGGTPERGVNAIEKAGKLLRILCDELLPAINERTHPITGPSTLNLGQIFGGTQPSTVAGECVIRLDRRWIPGESTESVLEELREIIRRLRRDDPDYDGEVRNMRDMATNTVGQPPLLTAPDSPLVRRLSGALSRFGPSPRLGAFPGWTDGGILSSAGGIETVVFGPGDLSVAHSDREFCPVDEVIRSCPVYLSTLLDLCL